MTDLELIEAAAKAAGHQTVMCYAACPEDGEPFAYAKVAKRTYFRPFSDDGDAFRLASVIGLIVNFASPIGESVSVKFYDIEVCVPVEGDRGAAARRAIVLAAARCATPPPAQPDPWHDAVLAECMAIEGAYKSDDPTATLRSLIDWHVMNERHPSRAAAPAEGAKTGWPPGMLQDDDWKLSRALADTPHARAHADEAAQAIREAGN